MHPFRLSGHWQNTVNVLENAGLKGAWKQPFGLISKGYLGQILLLRQMSLEALGGIVEDAVHTSEIENIISKGL